MDSSLIRLSTPTLTLPRARPSLSYKKIHSQNQSQNENVAFDEAAFEAERLSLDAKARETMMAQSRSSSSSSGSNGGDPKAWKWVIRRRIWDTMEALNIAQNPRPVHHRIPNFVAASTAAKNVFFCLLPNKSINNVYSFLFLYLLMIRLVGLVQLSKLKEFGVANCVKVNPDSPQKQVRFLTLSG